MRFFRPESRIIGGLRRWLMRAAALFTVLAATGCAGVRLAYNNGSQLTWWWIDGYVDFSRDQTPQVKRAIEQLFDWHRATQLPIYIGLLEKTQAQVLAPTTAAAVCQWQEQARTLLEPTLQRALQAAAEQLPGLGEAQFKAIDKRYAKTNKEVRDDYQQADAEDREDAAFKRVLDRTEKLYGRLGDAQKRVIRAGVLASPFSAEQWLGERQRRQHETLQTLRKLVADRADAEQRLTALRALVAHAEKSPDADYRGYQQKLADYNCAMAAQIHNATTPAQRERARETLKGWEEDLRSLAPPA